MAFLKQKMHQSRTFYVLVIGIFMWIVVYWIWKRTDSCCHIEKGSHHGLNSSALDSIVFDSQAMESDILKIMTWNLQGLMSDKLEKRTEAIVSVLLKQNPDAVFFQELIPSSFRQLVTALDEKYASVPGTENPREKYFTGIFYRKSLFKFEKHKIIHYQNTVMDRTLLVVQLMFGKIKLALMTSHLESLPRFSIERVEQLKECFIITNLLPKKYNVIFGGDLNLEDDEEVGLIPDNIQDLWQECGSLPESKYTWDSTENQNEKVEDISQQLKRRYDRLYFRHSTPITLQLKDFQLQGKELVKGTRYFPSDHWALVTTFKLSNESGENNGNHKSVTSSCRIG